MKTKRTILTTVLLLVSIIAFSQVQLVYETDDYMKFMGIPMKGDINTFAGELVKQGFPIKTSGLNLVVIKSDMM